MKRQVSYILTYLDPEDPYRALAVTRVVTANRDTSDADIDAFALASAEREPTIDGLTLVSCARAIIFDDLY